MKISACYIVKNEENVIVRSLKSLIDAVDEIIILDTGSNDRTMEVVKAYPKVKLYSYIWKNDFAAARNLAIEKAQGDWIVFLDADEFFSPETSKNIRSAIESSQDKEILLIRMKNIESTTGAMLSEFWAPRIFRRRPSLRYQGKIHEQICRLDGSMPEVKLIPAKSMTILHTGYSAAQSKEKAQRNLAMLKESMQHTKHPEEFYMYLAETYYGLGDMIQAERYARMDIAGGRRSITYDSRSYRLLLQLLAEKKAYVKRKEIAAKAVEAFPELPEFHAELAECLAYEFSYAQAVAAMNKALNIMPAADSLEISQFDEECCQMGAQRLRIWQRILDRMNTIRISACLIAKNEAKDLPRWLKNTSVYADETVIADTGSKDDTKSIAEKSGARVYSYSWQDDFAAAKNFVIERAQGDWIAFLDADEYFAEPEKIRGFLAWVDCCHPSIDAVMVMLSNIDEDDHNREIQRFTAVRLFRNSPALRYQGRIHEAVYRKDSGLQLWIEDARLLIYHTGYSSKRIQAKLYRNLSLLQKDIDQNGEQPGHYRYLADCYFGLKDYEKTLHYAMLAIHASVTSVGSQGDVYHLAIESMRQLNSSPEEMLAFLKTAIETFPDLPDYYAERGMVLSALGRLQEAERDLKKAIDIFEGRDKNSSREASYFHGAADKAYRRLAEICYQIGQKDQAEQYIKYALQLNPYRKGTLKTYRDWHQKESAASFATKVRPFFRQGKEDLEYICQWAANAGETEIFIYFDSCLQNEYSAGSVLRPFFVARQEDDAKTLYSLAVNGISKRMCALFSMLIFWQETIHPSEAFLLERAVSVLPETLQRLFQAYLGEISVIEKQDLDGYITLLPWIIRKNTKAQVTQYVNLTKKHFSSYMRQIADKLFLLEAWDQAGSLYEQLNKIKGSIKSDAEFCCNYGICCYQQQDYKQAISYLDQAKKLNCVRKDLAAYRKWSEDGLTNG